MGMFRIDGVRENQWIPQVFIKWLTEHKIDKAYKWDYEKLEQDNLKKDINNNTNIRRLNVKTNH
jgi:hypothetical protein